MQPIVLTARARIKGFWSEASYTLTNERNHYSNERLDSQKSQIRLFIGIVNEVEIDQLLHFDITLLHTVDNINEELGDILLDGHKSNNLLQGILLIVKSGRGKFLLNFREFIL